MPTELEEILQLVDTIFSEYEKGVSPSVIARKNKLGYRTILRWIKKGKEGLIAERVHYCIVCHTKFFGLKPDQRHCCKECSEYTNKVKSIARSEMLRKAKRDLKLPRKPYTRKKIKENKEVIMEKYNQEIKNIFKGLENEMVQA